MAQPTLEKWLKESCGLDFDQVTALPGDASFRRYYRVQKLTASYIAMDAAVEKQSCVPFVAIADALCKKGLAAPEVIASDIDQGYLLLSDFGDRLYLQELNATNAKMLYTRALHSLALMQSCRSISGWTLAPFTAEFMQKELDLFKHWFLEQHLQLNLSVATQAMLTQSFAFLAESAAMQPRVFMHRDYHSANLMLLPNDRVGVLDFQDAFMGPVTYDLVSLLRDCYIAWPEKLVTELVSVYFDLLALPNVGQEEFMRWFDLMGVQRHLKALLTFARKYRRDGNANYLQHVPRTLNYILTVSQRYPECKFLHDFIGGEVKPCVL